MAEDQQEYLRECLDRGICPVCHKKIEKKVGTGRIGNGVFCSLTCCAKWEGPSLVRRHQDSMQKRKLDE